MIRGPSASVYGGDSMMFGVVNLVTRSGDSLNGNEAALSLGSGLDRRARLTRGGETDGGIGYLGVGQRVQRPGPGNGFFLRWARPVSTPAPIGCAAKPAAAVRPARSNDWRATLTHSERDRIVPTGSYATDFNDPAHRGGKDVFTLAELGAVQALDSDTTVPERVISAATVTGCLPYTYAPRLRPQPGRRGGRVVGHRRRVVSRALAGQRWTVGAVARKPAPGSEERRRGLLAATACRQARVSTAASKVACSTCMPRTRSTWARPPCSPSGCASTSALVATVTGAPRRAGPETANAGIFCCSTPAPSAIRRCSSAYTTPTYVYGKPVLRSERMQSVEAAWEKRIGNGRLMASVYLFRLKG